MNLLTHPSIEASTGQVEIKCITSDQVEIKGFAANQNNAETPRKHYLNLSDQDVKNHADDQKEIKGLVYCKSNGNCDGSYHQSADNSATTVVKPEDNGQVIDLSKIDQDDDDDDFKPPKKKYRMVSVC